MNFILVSNDDVLNVAVVANGDEVIELDMSVDEEPTSQTRRRSSSSSDTGVLPPTITSSNKRKKIESDEVEDEKEDPTRTILQNDAEVCPICLEEWTNSGQHRLVATECGHLFGRMFVHSFFSSSIIYALFDF